MSGNGREPRSNELRRIPSDAGHATLLDPPAETVPLSRIERPRCGRRGERVDRRGLAGSHRHAFRLRADGDRSPHDVDTGALSGAGNGQLSRLSHDHLCLRGVDPRARARPHVNRHPKAAVEHADEVIRQQINRRVVIEMQQHAAVQRDLDPSQRRTEPIAGGERHADLERLLLIGPNHRSVPIHVGDTTQGGRLRQHCARGRQRAKDADRQAGKDSGEAPP